MTRTLPAATFAAALLGAATTAFAHAEPFTFSGVEYAPRDQRESLAQAYVARTMAPGTPMPEAIAAAAHAGARCTAPGAGGEVVCREASMEKKPGEDLSDISWTVRLTPTADGRVADATVQRAKAGF
ncbi:MAG: hypothetical protein INR64_05620 [Caulobacteraceae bacterium]|nr:hypothetical protein [Caulobacter sp.]